jgi:hypothetical protein
MILAESSVKRGPIPPSIIEMSLASNRWLGNVGFIDSVLPSSVGASVSMPKNGENVDNCILIGELSVVIEGIITVGAALHAKVGWVVVAGANPSVGVAADTGYSVGFWAGLRVGD